MLTIEGVQSFSFNMSLEHLGFPLPIKIEEEQRIIIDLDTEGNSPEDIVIEWHLEIRRFFGSFSEASGEIPLTRMMKEYIESITERAIHFEDVIGLHELVENQMESIYWFFRDSDICFSDQYLNYMEHILTFYVNLSLRALLAHKKIFKVTQQKVQDMTQRVIKRLQVYLLKSEYHIFHVLIRQTTTLVDGMIKDVMIILNSNMCQHMFRKIYMHFLMLTPVQDKSDEAFCRAFILFENWKAFEHYKQNDTILEIMGDIFRRDMNSIRENEFLRKILMPQTSIMSELMKVLGCDPSITRAYFDYIKSKQRVEPEIIDDVGKLTLEDALILQSELTDDDDDYETTYKNIFDEIMENVTYNLNDIVLSSRNCKNEGVSASGQAAINGEVEILISDTDSDSDVEIVSIVPSQNSSTQVPNSTKGKRNPAGSAHTSFLDSIEIDTSKKKSRFRPSMTMDNLPSKNVTETNKTTLAPDNTHKSSVLEDQSSPSEVTVSEPAEPSGQSEKNPSITVSSPSERIESSSSEPISLIADVCIGQSPKTTGLEVLSSTSVTEINADPDLLEIEVPSTSQGSKETSTIQIIEDISQIEVPSTSQGGEASTIQIIEDISEIEVPSTSQGSKEASTIQIIEDISEIEVPSTSQGSEEASTIQIIEDISEIEVPSTSQESEEASTSRTVEDISEIEVPFTSQGSEAVSQTAEDINITQDPPASNDSQVISDDQTNEKVSDIGTCSQITTPVISGKEPVKSSDSFSTILSTTKNVEVIDGLIQENVVLGTAVNLEQNIRETSRSSTGDLRISSESTMKEIEVIAQKEIISNDITVNTGSGTDINLTQKVPEDNSTEDNTTTFESTIESEIIGLQNAMLDNIVENDACSRKIQEVIQDSTGDSTNCEPMSVVNSCDLAETDNILNTFNEETNIQATVEISSNNQNSDEVELAPSVQITDDRMIQLEVMETNERQQTENTENIPLERHMSSLSLTPELTTEQSSRPNNGFLKAIPQDNTNEVNCTPVKDFEECHVRDRTLTCDKKVEVLKCRTASHLDELEICDSGCEKDKTIPLCENNTDDHYLSSITNDEMHGPLEETTPLDTGQDQFVQPLDTGQFDASSPASPENFDVNLKSLCNKRDVKLLRTVGEPLLRKTEHGEFGYPTPPGSEEERDKDLDEQTKLIYSNILPTQAFVVDETIEPLDSENEQVSPIHYDTLTSKKVQKQDFFSTDMLDHNLTTAENELLDRMHDKQTPDASPSLGKSYEQIVKDAIGSQNSTEDEEDETQTISRKYNQDEEQDINFDDMKEFLKNCENEDFLQAYRKKRKRPREKTLLEEIRSKKNSFVKTSPKRVKINEKPETYFITTSYDEDSKDEWEKQNGNEYDSSSSSDNEMHSNRPGVKTKRRPSPMPLSKYASKRNRTVIHIPLSERSSPDRPPPLKGILKQIELKHPNNLENAEPETVIIVLHQCEIGRGKRGSVEVKVYRKSFLANQIPFDDDKLCYHHAVVKMDDFLAKPLDKKIKVSDRTRNFEEEMFCQPEKPMYKIVFDKKTPELNSNDRKYFCDPSISSNSSTLLENEQGTVNLSTEVAFVKSPQQVEFVTEHAIPTSIPPPCFSPSSTSSSEFSDPINLIPYQDIERALQVVEPDKQCENAPDFASECQNSKDSLDKSLVDRIALETIELLSNNADFHKMLKDLNGDVLIENVPWIGVTGTGNIGHVTVVPNAATNNDDLVSNLNSDEQLLKKVCQELESKALVDNLTNDPTNTVTESFLGLNVRDDFSGKPPLIVQMDEIEIDNTVVESDQICYQGENNTQLSSFSKIPSNDVLLHGSMSSTDNSALSACSVANQPSVAARYSPPVTVSLHKDPYSSITNSTEFSSLPVLNSPIFTSNASSVSISPVVTFHQESCSAHVPTDQVSVMDLQSNSATLSRNPSPLNLHQQTFSTISAIPSDFVEASYSNSSSSIGISQPLVSPVSNSFLQATYSSIPDSTLVHSTYSEIGVSMATPLPVYSMSNSDSPIAVPVYPEDPRLQPNPQSQSTVTAASLFTTNVKTNSYVHNLPSSVPTYTETNCLIPNVPHFSKANDSKCNNYFEPSSSIPNIAENLIQFHRSSSIFPSLQNSSIGNFPPTNIPPIKTDKRRKRLPKEVLTISQLNESKSPNIDYIDNKSKHNPKMYSQKSKKCAKTKSNIALEIGNPNRQNVLLTNQSCPISRSADPRLGQPLFCVPPPFIRNLDFNKSSLIVNLPVSQETLKKLAHKKSLKQKLAQKRSTLKTAAVKSITKSNKLSTCTSSQKNVEKTASMETPKISTTENTAGGASLPELFSNAKFADSAKSLYTPKKDRDVSLIAGVSKNLSNSVASINSHKNIADKTTYRGIPKTDLDEFPFLETPNILYTTSLEATRNNVNSTTLLVTPENIFNDVGISLEAQNTTYASPLFENSMKIPDSVVSMNKTKNNLEVETFFQAPKNISDASYKPVGEDCRVLKGKAVPTASKIDCHSVQNILSDLDKKQTKSKLTGRKRGRPPKNAKSSSTKNSNKNVQHNIPPVSNIPHNSVHVIKNNCNERVPPICQSDISQRRYPATRNSTQPRVEPLKIVKDPKTKNCYTKVVKVNSSVDTKTTPLPMPVPETYNFETDTLKKEVYNIKPVENGETEVEFETHLPLKKRKLSMPVPSVAPAQPTTLANVPRSRDKKEEISYPATPMLSIADVYMQPRSFKTPAEKKQLPPESSNTVPTIRYDPPPPVPDPEFNCNLNTYAPALYGFGKCPYSVKLDCNSYCPPPVLFPPEPFSHSN